MSYIVTLLKLHRALNILSDLAENTESESVRLGATRDLLDRAGFRPVDRHEIVKEKSVEKLNAQLVRLGKVRIECADEITEQLNRNFAEIAPRALNIQSDLAENS